MSELSKFNNIAGKTFGKWLAVKECGKAKNGSTLWLFRCECGTEKILYGSDVFTGKSLSCKPCSKIKHGKSGTKLYMVWGSMIQRCVNPKNKGYENYGARGIDVCDEWKTDYSIFEAWAMNNGYKEGLLLDRQDNDKSYGPENCRWVTRVVQNNNRRSCRYLPVRGQMLSIAQAAKILGVNKDTLRHRIDQKANMGIEAKEAILEYLRDDI